MRIQYNKLVRDRIPEIINEKGSTAIVHIADKDEYWQKLQEKLGEEYEEFIKDPNVEELADILEVIHAICDYKKIKLQDLEAARIQKAEKRGAFTKRIILDETN